MNQNQVLMPYSPEWEEKYKGEAEKVKIVFGDLLLDVQHIGSTAIPGMLSKPIIDIGVLIGSYKDAEQFIKPLEAIGYSYVQENSSSERHFFRKGNPTEFHLSLAYADRTTFWKRQILFRDYLIKHPQSAKEYEQFKLNILKKDPTIDQAYTTNKDEFVSKIVALAEREALSEI